ncbi:MAG: hypothetical protein BZY87_06880 [SAR202 cluster bacterium Io17-Chloro-G6]|nr:MAG: hypothetical protein BZY87_06880 [SAR202 cluster bacterium Io17-Chloro-G6]
MIESYATPSKDTWMPVRNESASADLERQFTEIVEQYSDLAYSVAFRMLRNAEDAEDAVQEAYISALKALPNFKGQSKLSTWLYRIVVNACLMKIRKDKSRAKYLSEKSFDDAIVYDWKNDPEEAAVNSELRSMLESGLDLLSPDLRAAVVLRDIQGLSTEEAAEALGISIASLKSRLHRARIMLRKHLDEYSALSLLGAADALRQSGSDPRPEPS